MMGPKPVTPGTPDVGYFLFFPFRCLRNATPLDHDALREALATITDEPAQVEVEDDGIQQTIVVSNLSSEEVAWNCFARVLKFLRLVAVNAEYVLTFWGEPQQPQAGCGFPAGWLAGEQAGWEARDGIIAVDAMIDSNQPAIVDASKRVVRMTSGLAFRNQEVKRSVIQESAAQLIRSTASSVTDDQRIVLAHLAFLDAFSHENIKVRFLSLFTCIEVLAIKKRKGPEFADIINHLDDALAAYAAAKQGDKEESGRVKQTAAFLALFKEQSTADAVRALVAEHTEVIQAELQPSHDGTCDPVGMIGKCYKLRSKIAHANALSALAGRDFEESYEFLRAAARALVRTGLLVPKPPEGRPTTVSSAV